MAFEILKTDYKDDVLNTSVNQLRKYTLVSNADGSVSLIDVTAYSTLGTFIGAKDINTMCRNMNTIMGYIETNDGDLAQEFQEYFAEQKGIFEDNVETYMQDFQDSSQTQFTVWYDANTEAWSQEVANRINAIIASLTELVEDNGPFILNKAYKVGNLLTWNMGDGITRGYLVINPVPVNMGIYPTDTSYFMNVTREGAQGVGIGLVPRGKWNNQTTYVENDLVFHNQKYWWCKVENTDSEPTEDNTNWELQWDLTSDNQVSFEEPEQGLTFKGIIENIISGQTLGNLIKYIKALFLNLKNKFNDTEYVETGITATYDSSNNASVVISNIETSADDFYIISENDFSLNLNVFEDGDWGPESAKVYAMSNHSIVKANGNFSNTRIIFPCETELEQGNYIIKIIPISGNISDGAFFECWSGNPSHYFEEMCKLNFDGSNAISFEFELNYNTDKINMYIGGNENTTVNNYRFLLVICKKDEEYQADGVFVEAGNEQLEYVLDTYEGTTNVITTSTEQVSFTASFKTRFWTLNKKADNKIDKSNIAHNLATTNPDMVLGADMGKKLGDDVSEIKETLEYQTDTYQPNHITGSIVMKKISGVTEIRISGTIKDAMTAGLDNVIFVLPEKYRPRTTMHGKETILGGSNMITGTFAVRTNGEVVFNARKAMAVNEWVFIDETYI